MSIEEKFHAAVNVINGLPKHGPYQPSNEMKLSFYGYYKQATEGPNNSPKPWSWEVVKKAKWEAWSRLGNMTKDDAMIMYVQELYKIVETMSYTENVADFLKRMDDFDSNNMDNLASGEMKSILNFSPKHAAIVSINENSCCKGGDPVYEDEDECFTDSVDLPLGNNSTHPLSGAIISADDLKQEEIHNLEYEVNTTDILMKTVVTLRTELNEIAISLRKIEQKQKLLSRKNSTFRGLSFQSISFIIFWPFIVNLMLFWLFKRRFFTQ